ncbi:MAG: carbamoyltransferase HypF [Candidatus Saganbacteria bacterium]|nr:carbamoyltransferase HypF [Candidatus Saganbacteria bacterium]
MRKRKRIILKGIVQGVGYRPFVFDAAKKFGIAGYVSNTNSGVTIDAEAEEKDVLSFEELLRHKYPPKALLIEILMEELPLNGYKIFRVEESKPSEERSLLITPDLSLCKNCLNELFDPNDRRYLYPFITCTSCGPRSSIIKDTPYDRERTTMSTFPMCPECEKEYKDPANRRFHTEPNSCKDCGPKLTLYKQEKVIKGDPIEEATKLIKQGEIVAIKGLGGFHLVCDAENDSAVKTLRERKGRDKKPFAIMSFDTDAVSEYCEISKEEQELLESQENPIVLLAKKKDSKISKHIAPDNNYLGVMLPYTPIHYLLLKDRSLTIVATSGNRSEEPIASNIEEARSELKGITEYFLDHDRDIFMRIDDSVAKVTDKKASVVRRARGYAPVPIILKKELKQVLAVGGELKNTFCLTKGRYAFLSQHIGDLKSIGSFDHFRETIGHFKKLFGINPEIIAHDLHPEYLSTKFALEYENVKLVGIQHHHAHIASCMAENGVDEKVIGIAFDGIGYGTDGRMWGSEFLVADLRSFKRSAHLKYIEQPGGDKAAIESWRMAVSYLYRAGVETSLSGIEKNKIDIIKSMMDKKINSPKTSGMGRLFDAVSSILDICHINTFEGQAAMELEAIAEEGIEDHYDYKIERINGEFIIDPSPIISGIMNEIKQCVPKSVVSAKFHNTIAEIILKMCRLIKDETKLNKVALSGGCFQNKYLTEKTLKLLRANSFEVFTHSQVPCNDGGISLGQAVIANVLSDTR